MTDPLALFLEDATALTYQEGEWDCGFFMAAWMARLTGKDLRPEWAGRYRDAEGQAAVVDRAGGLIRAIDALAASAGAERTREDARGVVGIIREETAPGGLVGAVSLGCGLWAAIWGQGGIVIKEARALRMWRAAV